jgi:ribose/xylose/arabinose/galactoside ABC-type transport system permease subunit
MGMVLWIACGAAVFFVIRNIRFGRPVEWMGELFTLLLGSLVLGGVATALDFGGWNELDWRAAVFVVFGCFAIAGVIRVGRLFTRRRGGAEKGV